MALPIRYSVRSAVVRKASALLTALGIGLTVAVFSGVLALRNGFEQIYRPRGRTDMAIYLRPGAQSEGESGITRSQAEILTKSRPEIVRDDAGQPLAAAEMFLAVYMEKVDGGLTNVPLRGIERMSIPLQGDQLQLIAGDWLEFGKDEVVVGRPLTERMKGCALGSEILLNVTPFKVVGVFEHSGAMGSEVWGDAARMMEALERPVFQRVVARVQRDTDFAALNATLSNDPRTPVEVSSEREYLARQTVALATGLQILAGGLTMIMGVAAVLGAMNTMLAAVSSRTHEVGVLLAIGYRRSAVFLAFLVESVVISLIGAVLGILIILPFHGVETGAMNWNTFTDVTFAFRMNLELVGFAFFLAFVLGVVGGAIPATLACLKRPVDALRH